MSLKKTAENVALKVKKNIKAILIDIAVVIVSVAYVLYQLLTLKKTDLNPIVLIGQAIIGIITGITIKMALGEKGFIKGYGSKLWEDSFERYNSKCDIALPYIDNAIEFRELERTEKLERLRRTRLANHRMKYDEWFDENGDFIEHDIMDRKYYEKRKHKYPDFQIAEGTMILTKKQKRILYKCAEVKVYPLDLFSEYDANNEEDTKPETTDRDVRKMNLRKNTFFAVAIAMLGVYFIPTWKWNTGHFIWACMQVSLWLAFAIIQLYSNYEYVTVDKVNLLSRKEKNIVKFCKKYMTQEEFNKCGVIGSPKKYEQPKPQEQPKSEFIEVEMTEEELRAKGLIK